MQTAKTNKTAVTDLFNVGAHYGYTRSRRHPSAKPYLFGVKNKIEIFDLEKTEIKLQEAKEYMKALGAAGASVLFVGGKSEASQAVRDAGEALNMPYVPGRWIGGTLTNFPQIKKRIEKFLELQSQKEKGELGKYTKKERLLIDREIAKLEQFFGGLVPMKDIPKAMFVIDSKREHIAIKEAKFVKIPIVSLSGSDCNLLDVDYVIPGNDSSAKSIAYITKEIVAAYREGQASVKKA